LASDTAIPSFYVDRHPYLVDSFVKANREKYAAALAERKATLAEAQKTARQYLKQDEVYEVRVRFRNVGGLVWPLWVRLTFEGGAAALYYFPAEAWAKDNRLFLRVFYTREPVVRVDIDPWGLSLDVNPQNNGYPLQRGN